MHSGAPLLFDTLLLRHGRVGESSLIPLVNSCARFALKNSSTLTMMASGSLPKAESSACSVVWRDFSRSSHPACATAR